MEFHERIVYPLFYGRSETSLYSSVLIHYTSRINFESNPEAAKLGQS